MLITLLHTNYSNQIQKTTATTTNIFNHRIQTISIYSCLQFEIFNFNTLSRTITTQFIHINYNTWISNILLIKIVSSIEFLVVFSLASCNNNIFQYIYVGIVIKNNDYIMLFYYAEQWSVICGFPHHIISNYYWCF